jgi:hypothetical protein
MFSIEWFWSMNQRLHKLVVKEGLPSDILTKSQCSINVNESKSIQTSSQGRDYLVYVCMSG